MERAVWWPNVIGCIGCSQGCRDAVIDALWCAGSATEKFEQADGTKLSACDVGCPACTAACARRRRGLGYLSSGTVRVVGSRGEVQPSVPGIARASLQSAGSGSDASRWVGHAARARTAMDAGAVTWTDDGVDEGPLPWVALWLPADEQEEYRRQRSEVRACVAPYRAPV